jgi:hypothetical protein
MNIIKIALMRQTGFRISKVGSGKCFQAKMEELSGNF